jgi:hypothetical protein
MVIHGACAVSDEVKTSKDAFLPRGAKRQLNQRSVATFNLSKAQVDRFTTCLVKAIVTGNIAFSFVENPHMIEAMTSVGVPPITRKQLADRYIPSLAEAANVATAATLQRQAWWMLLPMVGGKNFVSREQP